MGFWRVADGTRSRLRQKADRPHDLTIVDYKRSIDLSVPQSCRSQSQYSADHQGSNEDDRTANQLIEAVNLFAHERL